jgi:hypothetical protein
MTRTFSVRLAVALVGLSACASPAPPTSGAASFNGPIGVLRRLGFLSYC